MRNSDGVMVRSWQTARRGGASQARGAAVVSQCLSQFTGLIGARPFQPSR